MDCSEKKLIPIPENFPERHRKAIIGEAEVVALYEEMKDKPGLENIWTMETALDAINHIRALQIKSMMTEMELSGRNQGDK